MANDAHEEFWGCTLSKDKKEIVWDPSAETEDDVEHKLQITAACLGHKAKDGERNLVEVTTEDDDGKKISCPIVSLRIGGKECIHLDLGFCNTTKFILKEGAGPLSLCGVHLQALPLDFDENEESSEDEEVPDLMPAKTKNVQDKSKKVEVKPEDKKDQKKSITKNPASPAKRPLITSKKDEQPAKKKKAAPVAEESDEESNEGEQQSDGGEDESDEELENSLLDNQAEEASDDDSEEGDDEPEGDDVDTDDEDDDDEMESDDDEEEGDSEDEEEEEKPAKKTNKKINGHSKDATPAKAKKEQKTPSKEQGKKENVKTPAKKTPEELKAFLLKSPNLPKKFDKFANFMKNNMKVTDQKSQKELWDYVQKNKK